MAESINVEVIYALESGAEIDRLAVDAGTTVRECIAASRLRGHLQDAAGVGIFGLECSLDASVADGDRIEIYRELICDPKTARRLRAESTR